MRHKNDLILKAFERHFQEQTRLIHFGVVAPILENALFALALFRKKEQKTMLEGKELFLRLLAYQSTSGLFPDAIHLMDQDHFSWKKNLYIAAVFSHLHCAFDRVIDKVSKEKIHHARKRLLEGLKKLELEGAMGLLRSVLLEENAQNLTQIASLEEAEILIVSHALAPPPLSLVLEDNICSFVLRGSIFYQGPFEGIRYFKGMLKQSLVEISMTSQDKLKEDESICDKVWMESVLTNDLSYLQGKASWLRHKDLHEKGAFFTHAYLDDKRGLTAALYVPENTIFDPERSVYTIHLEGFYEEDAQEICLYLPLTSFIAVHIDEAKSSVFREKELVIIEGFTKKIPLSFRVIEGEGKFIGQISLDSRPYECEKGGIYDRKISLRTVERSLVCKLEFFIGWHVKNSPF